MTGYDVSGFNAFLLWFKEAHDEYLSCYHLNGKPREKRRAHVIYSNGPLSCVEECLAFVLSCRKLNPLQELQADLFDMTQNRCCIFLHAMDHILHLALEQAGVVPAKTNEQLQEQLSRFGETGEDKCLLHDGTEQEVPRPQDDELQKEQYSGRKKKHTVKNAVIISKCYLILHVSLTVT
jgi:hypothetical protein